MLKKKRQSFHIQIRRQKKAALFRQKRAEAETLQSLASSLFRILDDFDLYKKEVCSNSFIMEYLERLNSELQKMTDLLRQASQTAWFENYVESEDNRCLEHYQGVQRERQNNEIFSSENELGGSSEGGMQFFVHFLEATTSQRFLDWLFYLFDQILDFWFEYESEPQNTKSQLECAEHTKTNLLHLLSYIWSSDYVIIQFWNIDSERLCKLEELLQEYLFMVREVEAGQLLIEAVQLQQLPMKLENRVRDWIQMVESLTNTVRVFNIEIEREQLEHPQLEEANLGHLPGKAVILNRIFKDLNIYAYLKAQIESIKSLVCNSAIEHFSPTSLGWINQFHTAYAKLSFEYQIFAAISANEVFEDKHLVLEVYGNFQWLLSVAKQGRNPNHSKDRHSYFEIQRKILLNAGRFLGVEQAVLRSQKLAFCQGIIDHTVNSRQLSQQDLHNGIQIISTDSNETESANIELLKILHNLVQQETLTISELFGQISCEETVPIQFMNGCTQETNILTLKKFMKTFLCKEQPLEIYEHYSQGEEKTRVSEEEELACSLLAMSWQNQKDFLEEKKDSKMLKLSICQNKFFKQLRAHQNKQQQLISECDNEIQFWYEEIVSNLSSQILSAVFNDKIEGQLSYHQALDGQ